MVKADEGFPSIDGLGSAHWLTPEIYKLTKEFPKEEFFALTNQIRRASTSIGSNIAEDCGRGSNKGYAHFLQMAIGSAFEVDYQLLSAKDLSYIDAKNYLLISEKIDALKRQLAALLQKVRSSS